MLHRSTRYSIGVLCLLVVITSTPSVQARKRPDVQTSFKGEVVIVDTKKRATVRSEDGEEYWMKGEQWQLGQKVQCIVQDNLADCTQAF